MATYGPNLPSAAVVTDNAGSAVTWANPTNVYSDNAVNATCTTSGTTFSDYLDITGFGFNIPSNQSIVEIRFRLNKFRSGGSSGQVRDAEIFIIKNGVAGGTSIANTISDWSTTAATFSDQYLTLPEAGTYTYADINSSNFGVRISVKGTTGGTNRVANIDYVSCTITTGTAYTQTVTATASAVTPGLRKSSAKGLTAIASAVLDFLAEKLTSTFPITLEAVSTAQAELKKAANTIKGATASGIVSVQKLVSHYTALVANGAASFVKRDNKDVTASSAGTGSVTKQSPLSLTAIANGVGNIAKRIPLALSTTATAIADAIAGAFTPTTYNLTLTASCATGRGTTTARSPTVGQNNTSIGTVAWTGPTNIYANDGVTASANTGTAGTSNWLVARGFGFSIPESAVLTGAIVTYYLNGSSSSSNHRNKVKLWLGTSTTTNDSVGSEQAISFGASTVAAGSLTNNWGATLTGADVNSPSFGVALYLSTISTASNQTINHVTLQISYKLGDLTLTKVLPPKTISATGTGVTNLPVNDPYTTGPVFSSTPLTQTTHASYYDWTDLGNATTDDGTYASVTVPNDSSFSENIMFYATELGIPAGATITSVTGTAKTRVSAGGFTYFPFNLASYTPPATISAGSSHVLPYNNLTNVWQIISGTLTAASLTTAQRAAAWWNTANSVITFYSEGSSAGSLVRDVDYITVTVTYTLPGTPEELRKTTQKPFNLGSSGVISQVKDTTTAITAISTAIVPDWLIEFLTQTYYVTLEVASTVSAELRKLIDSIRGSTSTGTPTQTKAITTERSTQSTAALLLPKQTGKIESVTSGHSESMVKRDGKPITGTSSGTANQGKAALLQKSTQSTGTASQTKSGSKSISAAAASVLQMAKGLSRQITQSVSSAVSVAKQSTKEFVSTAAGIAELLRIFVPGTADYELTLTAQATGNPTVIKFAQKLVSLIETATPTVQKGTVKGIGVEQAGSVVTERAVSKTATVQSTILVGLARAMGRVIQTAASTGVSLQKATSLTKTVTGGTVQSISKAVDSVRTATGTGVGTIRKAASRSITAAGSSITSIAKGISNDFAALGSSITSMSKRAGVTIISIGTNAIVIVKDIGHRITAIELSVPAISKGIMTGFGTIGGSVTGIAKRIEVQVSTVAGSVAAWFSENLGQVQHHIWAVAAYVADSVAMISKRVFRIGEHQVYVGTRPTIPVIKLERAAPIIKLEE